MFREIFNFWANFNVATGDLKNIGSDLRTIIHSVKSKTLLQHGKQDTSPCSKVKNIEDILVRRLEHRIKMMKEY